MSTDKSTPTPTATPKPGNPSSATATTANPATAATGASSGSTGSAATAGGTGSASAASGTTATGSKAGSEKNAADMAKETRDAAESRASQLGDKARHEAQKLADQARSVADSRVEEARSYATSNIERTADQIRNAGHEFGDDSYQARAADYLASNLGYAADVIRDKDLGSLADDVTHFARRNPGMFLGGATLLGFAVARMLKATERGRGGYRVETSRDSSDYRRDDYDSRFDAPTPGVARTAYDRPVGGYGR
ncbi:hypothetical protein [uncultured Jannaschia sp.]|uniref:hypothetical protein n=1 Tax=uncultured Jannaschia sp. TaxID=293347 RepID=UPI0026151447|nr:hypothetical protein [uncultured Jannaschia sp.]